MLFNVPTLPQCMPTYDCSFFLSYIKMSVKRLIWHENEPFLFALHTTYVYPKCTPILIEAYMVLGWLNMAQIENEQQWHFNWPIT